MNVLEIVIQRPAAATPTHFPVISEYSQSGNFLAAIRDSFMQARAQSQDNLRLLLVIEDTDLRALRWERLCVPDSAGDDWHLLALDQRVLYSRYLPSLTDRRFPPIGRRDLRALVVIASPAEGNRFNLTHFDTEENMAGLHTALAEIPHAELVAFSDDTGQLFLVDTTQKQIVTTLTHEAPVAKMAFNREGTALAVLTQANELVLWEHSGATWSVRGRGQEDPAIATLTNGVAWGVNGEPVTFHGRQVYEPYTLTCPSP